jgi:cytochrome b561
MKTEKVEGHPGESGEMRLLSEDSLNIRNGVQNASNNGGPDLVVNKARPLIQARYDRLSRVLHWLVAAGIFYTMIVGYSMHFVTNPAVFDMLSMLNMSVGLVVGALMPVRYFWRFYRPSVAEGEHLTHSHKATARLAHDMIYIIIFVVLISGLIMRKSGFAFFGIIEIPPLITQDPVNDFFFIVHRFSCIALGLMIIMHLAAVVKHHLGKYRVLNKML